MTLAGRTAVVTGGTRGLGAVIARALVGEGAAVVVAGRDVGSGGDGTFAVKTDVTVPESVADLMRQAHERFGGPHIVVANAGIARPGPVTALSADRWREVVDTNLTGVFHTVQAAAPYLTEAGGGRIVTVSSALGRRPMRGAASYCASKAAVEMFTQVCALELAPANITVNCLAPGFVDEGMGRDIIANEALWNRYRPAIAMARPGTGTEVARAAVFLTSDDSAYITGQTLNVDGGIGW